MRTPLEGGGGGCWPCEGPRLVAKPASLFNPQQSNCDSVESTPYIPLGDRCAPLRRKKYCGSSSVSGHIEGTPENELLVGRVNCKSWGCEYCGPRRAKYYKRAIRIAAEEHKLQRLLTLTLDPTKVRGDAITFINRLFAELRVYWRRKFGRAPKYIRVLEFQKNGTPHLHILIDRWMERAWVKASWEAIGGGWSVDVRYVDIHNVSRYLSKYLSKELLMSAPLWCRRVTTSRSIHLWEKPKALWEYHQQRIVSMWKLFLATGAFIREATLDAEGLLETFVAVDGGP